MCARATLGFAQTPVTGIVLDPTTGTPIAGARVRLGCGPEDPVFAKSDSDGRFRFEGRGIGCIVSAAFPGYADPKDGPNQSFGGVPAFPERPVEVKLARYAAIEGVVVDADGLPVPDADVETGDGRSVIGQTRTDDRGRYRIAPLASGTYTVKASPSFELRADPSYRQTARSVAAAGGKTARADFALPRVRGARVAGRISGAPPPGSPPKINTWVVLTPQDAPRPRYTPLYLAADNRFEIPDVLPGRYVLEAVTRERNAAGAMRDTAILGARQVIEVAEKDVEGVTVEMRPAQAFRGVAIAEGGCALPVSHILVTGSRLLVDSAVAIAPDGNFTLGPLPPGHYQLMVNAFGVSVRMGGQDISRAGFDVPSQDAEIRISIPCPRTNGGRP